MPKKKCLFLLPREIRTEQLFPLDTLNELESLVDVEYNSYTRQFTKEEVLKRVIDKSYIITSWKSPFLDEDIIKAAPVLEGILHAAGTIRPYLCDLPFERGIAVTTSNRIMSHATAEASVAMAMMGNHGAMDWGPAMKRGEWKAWDTTVPGIRGLTLGIIGYGAVTQAMLPMVRPFQPKSMLIYSDHLSGQDAQDQNLVKVELDDLLKTSDIIFLQTSLIEKNRHLLNKRRLGLIRRNSLLVNSGRGGLVDESALIELLKENRFRAVLDVFEEEPLPSDSPLRMFPNVICLPHLGAATGFCREEMGRDVVRNLRALLSGNTPEGLINLERSRKMSPL